MTAERFPKPAEPEMLETLPMPGTTISSPADEPILDTNDPRFPDPVPDECVPDYSRAPGSRMMAPPRREPEPEPREEVGYGKPPKSGQQKAGAPSKNPAGRPKGIPNPGAFYRLLNRKQDVDIDGKQVRRRAIDVIKEIVVVRAATNKAAFVEIRDRQRRFDQERIALEEELRKKQIAREIEEAQNPRARSDDAHRRMGDFLINMINRRFPELDQVERLLQYANAVDADGNLAGWIRERYPLPDRDPA